MRRSRLKREYFPSLDTMERRDLPSASPLAIASLRGHHAIPAEVGAHASMRHPVAGAARLRAPSSGAWNLSQADVAIKYLQLAGSVLDKMSVIDTRAEPAATQVRQALSQLTAQGQAPTSGALTQAASAALESFLDTFGPGDPFASMPVVATSALKPGDIIARCTPGLTSQGIELMNWSRYSHVALYIGDGKVIDAVANGVHTRSLSDLLAESNRVGVLRVPGLTNARALRVIRAAQAHEGAAYNFEGITALAAQKLAGVISHAGEGVGGIIGALSRAERLPSRFVNNGTYACSQLVRVAYLGAGITLSHANGIAPGDVTRLGLVGVLDEVGRLAIPTPASSPTGVWEL